MTDRIKHCKTCQQFQDDVGALIYAAKEEKHAGANTVSDTTSPTDPPPSTYWPAHETVLFNSLAELGAASNSPCPICRRVFRRVEKKEWPKLYRYKSVTTYLIFGEDKGEPVLQVRFEVRPTLRYPLQRNPRSLGGYIRDLEDGDPLIETLLSCAGLENASTGSEASFGMVRFWLEECLTRHPNCARDTSGWLPTRVIDVGDADGKSLPRLVESENLPSSNAFFVALSHCWGTKQIITTTLSTFEDRKRGIDFRALSKTFQEAVVTTRKLGQRYLWIDSLCIIQDSVEDWQKESVQMCMVYERAVFTIMAAHASSGDEGCFVERNGFAQNPLLLRFDAPDKSASQIACFQLPARHPGLKPRFSPVLFTRAWVLQEQWNSQARLIYFGEQVYWECRTMRGSEQRPLDGYAVWDSVSGLEGVATEKQKYTPESWEELHTKWCELVRNYTRRGITKSSDRQIAIEGIAQSIQTRTPSRYLAGLWSEQLPVGLMWYIPWKLTKSGTWHELRRRAETYLSSRHEKFLAPTWSWLSVTFPIDWTCLVTGDNIKTACEVLYASTQGTPFDTSGTIILRGMTRRLFVKPYFQSLHFTGTKHKNPKIQAHNAMNYEESGVWPHYICYASPSKPSRWRRCSPFPIEFLPDEIFDHTQPVTFIAVGYIPSLDMPEKYDVPHFRGASLVASQRSILTLALQPTGEDPDTFRRVGFASWNNCSWFGYFCVSETYRRESLRRLLHLQETQGWGAFWRELPGILIVLIWGGLLGNPIIQMHRGGPVWFRGLVRGNKGKHEHEGDIESEATYRKGWDAEKRTIRIV